MQIEIVTRYLFTHIRMAVTKKKMGNNKCLQGCEEIGTLVHCGQECEMVQETVWQFLKNLKIELPYDPIIPLLGIYPKELKAGS